MPGGGRAGVSRATVEVIDAYAHCGLSKWKPFPDLKRALDACQITKAVLVQHLGEYDNGYIRSVVRSRPKDLRGVCLVKHSDRHAPARLERWSEGGAFRGVRLLAKSVGYNPALWRRAVDLKLNIIVYDAAGISNRLRAIERFLQRQEEARLVLSHMGMSELNPELARTRGFSRYRDLLKLSQYPGVIFQLSGLNMFCPYPYEQLWRHIELAVEQFGPGRVLWGGNYPAIGSDDVYVREVELMLSGRLPIPREMLPDVLGRTAERVWFE